MFYFSAENIWIDERMYVCEHEPLVNSEFAILCYQSWCQQAAFSSYPGLHSLKHVRGQDNAFIVLLYEQLLYYHELLDSTGGRKQRISQSFGHSFKAKSCMSTIIHQLQSSILNGVKKRTNIFLGRNIRLSFVHLEQSPIGRCGLPWAKTAAATKWPLASFI